MENKWKGIIELDNWVALCMFVSLAVVTFAALCPL